MVSDSDFELMTSLFGGFNPDRPVVSAVSMFGKLCGVWTADIPSLPMMAVILFFVVLPLVLRLILTIMGPVDPVT